jgi:hypothetical protein
MPDEVRCTNDSNHVFTCDVFIGPDPEPAATNATTNSAANASKGASGASSTPVAPAAPHATATTPPSAPVALSPAVSALVENYKPTVLPPVDVPYLTGHAVLACSGNEVALLLIAGATKGPLAAVSAFKAGLDISKCLVGEHTITQAAAGRAEAAEYCAASGGSVTSVVDNRTYCAVPEGSQ